MRKENPPHKSKPNEERNTSSEVCDSSARKAETAAASRYGNGAAGAHPPREFPAKKKIVQKIISLPLIPTPT